ncbi:venom allergen 3-like [Ornithodoros turicata]|uniref:venom allergen 3-like n=1 Tax=Ornithodoros turicata TaxID=34597 RepID=UPI00313988A6
MSTPAVFSALWLLLCGTAILVSSECDYKNSKHTMCKYKEKACPGKILIRSGGIPSEDRELIVDLHNMVRSWVASGNQKGLPPAVNMMTLKWDEELAKVAQRWADQCLSRSDKDRSDERFRVGQNVGSTWSYHEEDSLLADPDWETQILAWYRECAKTNFKANNINPFRYSVNWGHFTQMIWAETRMVGCGYSYYYQKNKGFTKLYICNYGPGGNIIGGRMYRKSSRVACKDGFRQAMNSYLGLCENDAPHDESSSP